MVDCFSPKTRRLVWLAIDDEDAGKKEMYSLNSLSFIIKIILVHIFRVLWIVGKVDVM